MNDVRERNETDRDVVVYSAANLEQAHLLKFALLERGIVAEVTNGALQGAVGSLPFGLDTAPRVIVRAKDAEGARQFAMDFDRDLRSRLVGAAGERHWFQYSIYALLILTTCVAVYLGVTRALPGALRVLVPTVAVWTFFTIAIWRAYRRRQQERARDDESER